MFTKQRDITNNRVRRFRFSASISWSRGSWSN